MAEVQITDEDSARAWFETQPPQIFRALAARAALRALPGLGLETDEQIRELLLPVLRAVLISGVAGTCPTPEVSEEIRSAAESAADSARYSRAHALSSLSPDSALAAFSALSAAYSALSITLSPDSALAADTAAASAADSARSAAYSALSGDASHDIAADGTRAVFDSHLWPEAMSDGLATGLDRLAAFWDRDPTVWGFWKTWYRGMLHGTPMDWALQEAVALIPDEDWEQGAADVAQEIAKIEIAYLGKRLPQAERIELDPETETFHAVPVPVGKPDLLDAALSQMGDALDDVLANSSNGLTERSRETLVLRRLIAKYGDDPQRIEMDCVSVAQSLRRQMSQTEELPESEENLALLAAVEQSARAVRATNPEVAENREILARAELRELTGDEKDLLADVAPLLESISDSGMAEDFAADISDLLNDAVGPVPRTAPPLPGVTRVFNRASKMKVLYDASVEKGAAIFDSPQFKTVRLGLTVSGALSALVGIGLRILGVL